MVTIQEYENVLLKNLFVRRKVLLNRLTESRKCRALPKNGGTNRTTPRSENKATPRPTSLRCFFQTLPEKTLMRTQPLFCNKTPPKVIGMFPSIALQAILPDSLSPARGHKRQFFSASFVTDVDPEDETRVHCQSECGGKKGTREERQDYKVRHVCCIFKSIIVLQEDFLFIKSFLGYIPKFIWLNLNKDENVLS